MQKINEKKVEIGKKWKSKLKYPTPFDKYSVNSFFGGWNHKWKYGTVDIGVSLSCWFGVVGPVDLSKLPRKSSVACRLYKTRWPISRSSQKQKEMKFKTMAEEWADKSDRYCAIVIKLSHRSNLAVSSHKAPKINGFQAFQRVNLLNLFGSVLSSDSLSLAYKWYCS